MYALAMYYCGLLPLDLHILMVWGHYQGLDGKSKSTRDVTPHTQASSERYCFLFSILFSKGNRPAGKGPEIGLQVGPM